MRLKAIKSVDYANEKISNEREWWLFIHPEKRYCRKLTGKQGDRKKTR